MLEESMECSPIHCETNLTREVSSSRCLSPRARRLDPLTTAIVLAMVVLMLVSNIDDSLATTTGTNSRTWGTHHRKGRGWNLEKTVRGGSMATLQQQQQEQHQPPPPPPPPRQGSDEGRRYQQSLPQWQIQENSSHQLQVHQPSQQRQYAKYSETYYSFDRRTRGQQEEISSVLPKKIDLEQVTKVLLHTSETNQRLQQAVNHWGRNKRLQLTKSPQPSPSTLPYSQPPQTNGYHYAAAGGHHYPQQQQQLQYGGVYGRLPVNVHPSRTWQPSIRESSGRTFEDEELTLFHAKIPRTRASADEADESSSPGDSNADTTTDDSSSSSSSSNEADTKSVVGGVEPSGSGARYWGPDLLPYLEHILYELLGVEKEGSEILLVLAMIYLDRACSVETPRTNHQQYGGAAVPPCPFCAPRTIHRLSLSALVVATKAFRSTLGSRTGGSDDEAVLLSKLSRGLGIPLVQLRQMVEWMLLSLGDGGLYVSMEELRSWSRSWDSFFPSEDETALN